VGGCNALCGCLSPAKVAVRTRPPLCRSVCIDAAEWGNLRSGLDATEPGLQWQEVRLLSAFHAERDVDRCSVLDYLVAAQGDDCTSVFAVGGCLWSKTTIPSPRR
jgi:hypothetical protein